MGNCCRRRKKIDKISILLLGYEDSGKTEIGHILTHQPRIDFASTKGVRVFDINAKGYNTKLTEIGGSDSVREIWPHYFNDAFGIVYVIDCSIISPFDSVRNIFVETMSHPNVCGKPLLIVANKQDINDSVDIVDVTYFFGIDDTSQTFGTPYKIVASGTNYRMELNDGIDWLIDCIIKNYKTLKNRILFNRLLTPIKRIKRQRTSLMKKRTKVKPENRLKSAPSSFALDKMSTRNQNSIQTKLKVQRITTPVPTSMPCASSIEENNLFRMSPIVVHHL